MLIEMSNGQKVDTASEAFKRLPAEMQTRLIEAQEKLEDRRKRKRIASAKCRALKQGKPWPPEGMTEDEAVAGERVAQ